METTHLPSPAVDERIVARIMPLTASAALELATTALATKPGQFLMKQVDVVAGPTAPLETAGFIDSFLPSLMPRASVHQGLAAGLNVLTARFVAGGVEAVNDTVLPSSSGLWPKLGLRALEMGAGQGLSSLPEVEGENLWRSGARTGGAVLTAVAAGGAAHDVVQHLRSKYPADSPMRPLLTGTVLTTGFLVWASRRLAVRKAEIKRWPVDQEATTFGALGVGAAVTAIGTGMGKGFTASRRGLVSYFGPGVTKNVLARVANAGLWAGGLSAAYNAGIGYIGRANEKIEPAYAQPPHSELLSGGAESQSPFAELGQQGRRYVSDVVTPEMIEEVVGEPAAAHPIRAYVGFNSAPLYSTGRAELAMAELERTGALDREYLLLISPTGTGWVDQTVVEAAEFFARGDIASCAIQYGRFPSFLCVQKVGLGRIQFRLLLWSIKQRLAERPPEQRPKVLVFGESLGAWTSSDVVMGQGIYGFDHYGIDRALWLGLPALAKWSRNGMATGSSELVPDGSVGVFDRHEQLAALDDEARDRLRAVILSHDNDPIAGLRPELAIRRPDWLRDERGRNVPNNMDWIPLVTLWQVAVDAANAMVTVPGEFRSFGHDYRGDTARFIRDAYHFPNTDEATTQRIEDRLIQLDLERKERIKAKAADDAPIAPAARLPKEAFHGEIPMQTEKASGPRWLRKGNEGAKEAAEEDAQEAAEEASSSV